MFNQSMLDEDPLLQERELSGKEVQGTSPLVGNP